MLIDTHAHVNFSAYKDDADEVLQRALESQVFVVNVGSQYSTSVRAVEMAKKYPEGIYACVGIHPLHLQEMIFMHKDDDELDEVEIKTREEDFDYDKYFELAQDKKVVAIGEVGLDYHHFDPPRACLVESRRVDEASPRVEAGEGDDTEKIIKKQKEVLIKFIKLANEVEKPLMIHCWGVKSDFKKSDHPRTDAYEDLLEILKNNPVEKRGIIHSFVGGYKTAQKFIELGYKIGLNGIVTYGISYDRLIREIDLEDIVIETDCPYLTPVPKKGERNEPTLVKLVAKKIADIKGISAEEVAKITTENAKKSLKI